MPRPHAHITIIFMRMVMVIRRRLLQDVDAPSNTDIPGVVVLSVVVVVVVSSSLFRHSSAVTLMSSITTPYFIPMPTFVYEFATRKRFLFHMFFSAVSPAQKVTWS